MSTKYSITKICLRFAILCLVVFGPLHGAELSIRLDGGFGRQVEILETGSKAVVDSAGLATFKNISVDDYTVCIECRIAENACNNITIKAEDTIKIVKYGLDVLCPKDSAMVTMADTMSLSDTAANGDTLTGTTDSKEMDDSYELQKVTVKGRKVEKKGLGKQTISREQIKKLPSLAEPDVMRAIQLMPGVVASSDFSNKLYVRGGASDQNLILLDNAVVYSPSHFGGLFSTFAIEALDEIQFYKGGFSPKYGNRLASVLDIRQRNPKPGILHGNLGVSLLSSKIGLETSFEKGGLMLHGRRTYIDQVTRALNDAGFPIPYIPYYFYDGQGIANFSPTPNARLAYSYYGGRDFLDFLDLFKLDWGNQVHAFNYSLALSDQLTYAGTFSYSKFRQVAAIARLVEMTNAIREASIKQEFRVQLNNHNFNLGAEGFYFEVDFIQDMTIFDLRYEDLTFSRLFAGYAFDSWDVTDKLNLNYGLRTTYYPPTHDKGFEPRLSMTYALSDLTELLAHIGHYRQYMTSILFSDQEMPTEYWYALQGDMPTTTSNMVSYGIKREVGENYALSLEGYNKDFNDIPIFMSAGDTSQGFAESSEARFWDLFESIEGFAFGFEAMIEKEGGFLDGNLSYSMSYAVLKKDSAYFANWDKNHTCKAILNLNWFKLYSKEPSPQFQVSSHIASNFGTGLPYTQILGITEERPFASVSNNKAYVYGAKNNSRYPFYERTDFTPFRIERDGKLIDLAAYLQIINVFDHRNIYFYFYDTESDPPTREEIIMLPRIPIFFGFEMSF